MEDIHNFSGGLHTNFDEQNQPPNTYRDALNWIRLEDGSLTNENGIKVLEFPNTLTVIGSCVLGEEIILFSVDDTDSHIGVVDKYNVYNTLFTTPVFGFASDLRIKAEAKLDYRGHRIVFFHSYDGSLLLRRLDLDNVTYVDLDAETKAQLAYTLPQVTVDEVTEEGNLPTGVYQFSARLLTSSSNPTTNSLLTNIVPLVDESRIGGEDVYDGALPQTESFKAIKLSIDNIDTNFKFIQIIATTYEGLTNTPKSNIVGTKLITSDSMDFIYYSLDQNQEELTLDEITVEPINLDYPKASEQKDGHLVIANLKTTYSNESLQELANNIVVKYVIKEMQYDDFIDESTMSYSIDSDTDSIDSSSSTTLFEDYKNELNTTNFKGYQRDEVYSFAIAAKYKNGSYGYAYHIPGLDSIETPADTTTMSLGTYVCTDEEYPTGFNFGSLEGQKVRYHKMPSMIQEPIYVPGNTTDNYGTIRVLGVEFTNIDKSLIENNEDIIGFVFLRELRTESNKSILAQGIINPVVPITPFDDTNTRIVAPFAGKISYPIDAPYGVAFYSPETTIYKNNMKSSDYIQVVGYLKGDSYVCKKDTTGLSEIDVFLNYKQLYPYLDSDSEVTPVTVDKNTISYIPPVSNISPSGTTYKLLGINSNGFLLFNTTAASPIYSTNVTDEEFGTRREIAVEKDGVITNTKIYLNDILVDSGDLTTFKGTTRRNLVNLVADLPNQYGEVLDKEYIYIGESNDVDDESITCYGGDTFINKVALMSKTVGGLGGDESDSVFLKLAKTSTLSYFFCESSINTAYRHSTDDTLRYYPKYKKFWTKDADGLFQYSAGLGHANGYNKQYSFDNSLKKFYSKSLLLEEEVERFSNRILYSEQAIEGEQFDAYRLFLPNNYHDIPKNKGEITNLFTHNSTMYAHTSQSLWKLFFNEQVTQITSSGEVSLGNGGLFNRPAIEMFPSTGGYAGSVNPLATCETPFGVFFVDGLQRKVFLFGESFEEVDAGMRLEFSYLLKYASFSLEIADPITGNHTGVFSSKNLNSVIGVYDYKNDRYILSINNYGCEFPIPQEFIDFNDLDGVSNIVIQNNDILVEDGEIAPVEYPGEGIIRTISYSPKLKSWTSYHSYSPIHMVSVNNKVLLCKNPDGMVNNAAIGLLNEGNKGNYFGAEFSHPSDITIISNTNPLYTKVYDSLAIDSSVPFVELQVNNTNEDINGYGVTLVEDDSWEFEPASDEQRMTKKNNEYRVAIPVEEDDIRLKGKWSAIRLIYNNSPNEEMIVKYIKVNYRINAR